MNWISIYYEYGATYTNICFFVCCYDQYSDNEILLKLLLLFCFRMHTHMFLNFLEYPSAHLTFHCRILVSSQKETGIRMHFSFMRPQVNIVGETSVALITLGPFVTMNIAVLF